MEPALEVSGQAGQARSEQARPHQGLGQGGRVITPAVITPNAVSGVFDDRKGVLHQLDLLEGPLVFLVLRRANPVGGIDRAALQTVGDATVDLIRSKGWPLVLGMPLLAADPSLALFPAPLFLGFDNVTGGRLGRISRMLAGSRQLG